ncbi:MAG: class II glutamine amidotransferase [Candidatus Heimdallarchaeota archaeon]
MCRLLGVVANKPGKFSSLIEQFKEKFSRTNPDGWGIGWYENGKGQFFKEGIPAHDPASQLSRVSKEVKSQIILVHVRKLSIAPRSQKNSHPFQENDWLFIHNGAVNRNHLYSLLKPKYKQQLEGETDSEVYFYWVLQNIESNNNDVIKGVKDAIKEVISRNYTGLTFLLSDGITLYAFRYSQSPQDAYTLYKLEKKPSNLDEAVVFVCSEPLTDEEWDEIKFGHILIVKNNLDLSEVKILGP